MRSVALHRALLAGAVMAVAAVPVGALTASPVSAAVSSMCGPLAPPGDGMPCGQGFEIRFGPGESRWSFDGGIYDDTQVWYFRARGGQLLQLNFAAADRNVTAHVFAPDGTALLTWGPDDWGYQEAVLPASGRYAIVLHTDASSAYGMSMGIDSPGAVTMGYYGRIRFAPGTDNLTVSNAVLAADRDVWVFDADAGQDGSVYLSSVESNAVFDMYDPHGVPLATDSDTWYGTLPTDGTYMLIVSSTARNATYELTLSIPRGINDGREVSEHTGGKEIRFAPGTNNGIISGTLAPGTGDGWELRASAGQRLIIDSLGDFVTVEVYTRDGRPLLTAGDHNAQAVADLPVSGVYYVYVWAPYDAPANFQLRLTIP